MERGAHGDPGLICFPYGRGHVFAMRKRPERCGQFLHRRAIDHDAAHRTLLAIHRRRRFGSEHHRLMRGIERPYVIHLGEVVILSRQPEHGDGWNPASG